MSQTRLSFHEFAKGRAVEASRERYRMAARRLQRTRKTETLKYSLVQSWPGWLQMTQCTSHVSIPEKTSWTSMHYQLKVSRCCGWNANSSTSTLLESWCPTLVDGHCALTPEVLPQGSSPYGSDIMRSCGVFCKMCSSLGLLIRPE